jgi:hypothetical protein
MFVVTLMIITLYKIRKLRIDSDETKPEKYKNFDIPSEGLS